MAPPAGATQAMVRLVVEAPLNVGVPGELGSVVTLLAAEGGPSPLAFVATTRYQYAVFEERAESARVVDVRLASTVVHEPVALGARSSR